MCLPGFIILHDHVLTRLYYSRWACAYQALLFYMVMCLPDFIILDGHVLTKLHYSRWSCAYQVYKQTLHFLTNFSLYIMLESLTILMFLSTRLYLDMTIFKEGVYLSIFHKALNVICMTCRLICML